MDPAESVKAGLLSSSVSEFLTPRQTTEQFNQIHNVQMYPPTDCWALTQCPVSWLDSLPVFTVFSAACLYTENPFRP